MNPLAPHKPLRFSAKFRSSCNSRRNALHSGFKTGTGTCYDAEVADDLTQSAGASPVLRPPLIFRLRTEYRDADFFPAGDFPMAHDATEDEIAQLRAVDQISDLFEERWRSGDQPTIEEFLATAPEEIRERLLLELLPLELDWRCRNRLPVAAEEYQQRFFNDRDVISSVLADWFRDAPAQVVLDDTKLISPGDKLAVDSTFDVSRAEASSAPAPVTSTEPDQSLSIPRQIGRYEVIRLLGSGAMGAVYLARDPELGRQVAVKVPKLEGTHGNTSAQIERFQREARAAATLHHPNLCSVFDVGEADGVRYITMAYIEGHSLSQVSRRGRQHPERQVATLGRKLALALQVAHDAGVVHRDLKPGNIMIDKSNAPVIMDFGLALLVEGGDDARITHSGTIVGSPAYMSPEQVSGNPEAVGPPSDIYSLGVVLFELLTGQLPFQGGVMAVLRQIESSDPPSIESLRPDADAELVSIISTMMARKTEDRYPTMQSAASDLTRWLRRRGGQSDTGEYKFESSFQSTVRSGAPAIEGTLPAQRRRTGRQSAFVSVRTRVALSMLAVLVLAAVIVFRLGTTSIRIEVNDDRVAVELDHEKITLTDLNWRGRRWNGKHNLGLLINGVRVPIGKELPFKIDGNSHRLIATLGGAELSGDEFEIQRGGDTALKITLSEVHTNEAAATVSNPTEANSSPIRLRKVWQSQIGASQDGTISTCQSFHFVSDGQSILTAAPNKINLLSLTDGAVRQTLPFTGSVLSVVPSSGRNRIVATVMDTPNVRSIEVRDLDGAQSARRMVPAFPDEPERSTGVSQLGISPDGSICVFGTVRTLTDSGRSVDLVAWDVEANTILWRLSLSEHSWMNFVRFSHNGQMVLVGGETVEGGIKSGPILVDAKTGKVASHLGDHVRTYKYDGEFLPDDSAILLGTDQGTLVKVSVTDPGQFTLMEWPSDSDDGRFIADVEILPDGRFAIAARGDGKIGIWDVRQGSLVEELDDLLSSAVNGHYVETIQLSPNGRYVAICGRDGTLNVFELETDLKPETLPEAKDASTDFLSLVETTPVFEDNFNDELVLLNVNQNFHEIRNGHLIYDSVTPKNYPTTYQGQGLQMALAPGLVEVDVRSPETDGYWMICLGNADIQSSMTLSVEHGALMAKISVPEGSERKSSRQIISTDLPLRGGQEFDRVQLLVRKRNVDVAINGKAVGSVTDLPFDLTPGQASLGYASQGGHVHVECDRMAFYRFQGPTPEKSEQPSIPPEMVVQAGQEIDLLKVTPLDQMLYYGAWQQTGRELQAVIAASPNRNLLELPVHPQGEYDLEIDVTCPHVPNLTIRLPMAETGVSADFTVAAYGGQAMAIGVRNLTAMTLPEPIGRRPSAIKAGQRHAVVAKVRRKDDHWSISGLVDGEEVVHWKGELIQLSVLHRAWQSADLLRPVVGQWFDPNAEMTIHAARLRVVSGEAHLMPEPSYVIPTAARAKPKIPRSVHGDSSATGVASLRKLVDEAAALVDDFDTQKVLINDSEISLTQGDGRLAAVRKLRHKGGGWWAWPRIDFEQGLIEFEARVVGDRGGWLVVLQNRNENHGFRVMCRDRTLSVGASIWDNERNDKYAGLTKVLTEDAAMPASGEFDTVQLLIRRRSVQVCLNGQSLGAPIETPYDITPGNVRLGLLGSPDGDARVEYRHLEFRPLKQPE